MRKREALILVVDPEREIVRLLRRHLLQQGYNVLAAKNGNEAWQAFVQYHPDLLLLESQLPDISGLEICDRIRANSSVPIIILSTNNAEQEMVKALDQGADDYIIKPFGIHELLARVRKTLHYHAQVKQKDEPLFRSGSLLVDVSQRRVMVNEKEVMLTPTEFRLLHLLITHHGKILTHGMLIEKIWGTDQPEKLHNLHVHMAVLRKKIEAPHTSPGLIQTIPGVGYCLQNQEVLS